MSKFAKTGKPRRPIGPVTAASPPVPIRTHQGGVGHTLSNESELYKLAVTNLVGEDTFYESGSDRDRRFLDLVHAVTQHDPAWVAGFVPWLRDEANLRTAPVVMALEYARAGGPNARQVIKSAMRRADEPAEALGYWISRYGKKLPAPVKRGIADSVRDLYNQSTPVRYDSSRAAVRPGDVIELVHPTPKSAVQSELFKLLIDRRHNRAHLTSDTKLLDLNQFYEWEETPKEAREAWLRYAVELPKLANWEHLGSWLPGGWTKRAWELVIPQMGYMALLRNLRNFDAAGIDGAVRLSVASRLQDPLEVMRSRQFPMRFLSAWKAARSMRWGPALEDAVTLSCSNVPELRGNTLLMLDVSPSMDDRLSAKSELLRYEAAAIFAGALSNRNPGRVAIFPYSSDLLLAQDPTNPVRSILRFVEKVRELVRRGNGTETWRCLQQARALAGNNRVDRIVIITDEQTSGVQPSVDVPMYIWNVGGYKPSSVEPSPGVYVLGGLTDASFSVINHLEAGRDAAWPWMVTA